MSPGLMKRWEPETALRLLSRSSTCSPLTRSATSATARSRDLKATSSGPYEATGQGVSPGPSFFRPVHLIECHDSIGGVRGWPAFPCVARRQGHAGEGPVSGEGQKGTLGRGYCNEGLRTRLLWRGRASRQGDLCGMPQNWVSRSGAPSLPVALPRGGRRVNSRATLFPWRERRERGRLRPCGSLRRAPG